MHDIATPTTETKVVVRGTNFDLPEDLRNSTAQKAARLLAYNAQIQQIRLTLESYGEGTAAGVVAKGEIVFDGPALFTSVTAPDAAQAVDYLMERLEHQLRRHRTAGRLAPSLRRPPLPAGARSARPTVPHQPASR